MGRSRLLRRVPVGGRGGDGGADPRRSWVVSCLVETSCSSKKKMTVQTVRVVGAALVAVSRVMTAAVSSGAL